MQKYALLTFDIVIAETLKTGIKMFLHDFKLVKKNMHLHTNPGRSSLYFFNNDTTLKISFFNILSKNWDFFKTPRDARQIIKNRDVSRHLTLGRKSQNKFFFKVSLQKTNVKFEK